jgi:hypothetical protein
MMMEVVELLGFAQCVCIRTRSKHAATCLDFAVTGICGEYLVLFGCWAPLGQWRGAMERSFACRDINAGLLEGSAITFPMR